MNFDTLMDRYGFHKHSKIRNAMHLILIEKLSAAEAAKKLGKTPNEVKNYEQAISRARKKLQEKLCEICGHYHRHQHKK